MHRIQLTLPLSFVALAIWMGLTLSGRWLQPGSLPATLAASVADGIGLPWVLAALFALALLLASSRRRAADRKSTRLNSSHWE